MSTKAQPSQPRRRELVCVIALAVVFMCFTWRCVTMFFSDDDMMNMFKAWTMPAMNIWEALLLPWMPVTRPLGTAVYRVAYEVFGFHPLPLYLFCWTLQILNVFLAWRFFRAVASSAFIALTALSLTLVHGLFQDLYLSAGTIYDQLSFSFTALAVIVYIRARRAGNGVSPGNIALLCFITLMAMNSKESGAALPAILLCCEFLCIRMSRKLRDLIPVYAALGMLLAIFIFGRIRHTSDLTGNPFYRTHLDFHFWLSNIAQYLNTLLYLRTQFDAASAAIVLVALLVLAAILRNRTMLFGWLYFVITITPVALIPPRAGYVLYVPFAGLGLYFAALIARIGEWISQSTREASEGLTRGQAVAVAGIAVGMISIHAANWPAPRIVRNSSEWRLTERMRHDYPALKRGAKILFADDYPTANGYDLFFDLCLLYRDPTIEVARLKGPAIQQPNRPVQEFDHVFTTGRDTYLELDHRNVAESIRLNILKK
jgi:hypothetical protein